MKTVRILTLLTLIFPSTPAFGEEVAQNALYCAKQNKVLTADDFLEHAFSFEVASSLLPTDVNYTSVEALLATVPNCCEARWIGQPFPEPWWYWLFQPSRQVQTTITWDDENNVTITYQQSICGEILSRVEPVSDNVTEQD